MAVCTAALSVQAASVQQFDDKLVVHEKGGELAKRFFPSFAQFIDEIENRDEVSTILRKTTVFELNPEPETASQMQRSTRMMESPEFLKYLLKKYALDEFDVKEIALAPKSNDFTRDFQEGKRLFDAREAKKLDHVEQSKAVIIKKPSVNSKAVVYTDGLMDCVGVSFHHQGVVFGFIHTDLLALLSGKLGRLIARVLATANDASKRVVAVLFFLYDLKIPPISFARAVLVVVISLFYVDPCEQELFVND